MQWIVRAWPLLAWGLFAGILTGCNTVEPPPPGPGAYDDQVKVGHKITILFTEPGMPSPWAQTVAENGKISLPHGLSAEAAGKTTTELAEDIREIYVPHLYRRMTVVVQLEDRYYWVKGEVRSPGQLRYTGSTTILNAITAAGDYTEFADRGHVHLVRNNETYRVGNNHFDTPVYPGDTIIVDRRL